MARAGLIALVLVAVLAAPLAVSAEEVPPEKKAGDRRVCKSEKVTGSLTRIRRICMAQREWDQLARAYAEDLDEMSRQRSRTDAYSVENTEDRLRFAPAPSS